MSAAAEAMLREIRRRAIFGPALALNDLLVLSQVVAGPGATRRVRHGKRGTTYSVIGTGSIQTGSWTEEAIGQDESGANYCELQSVDMAQVVVYQSEGDGSLWVRPADEFEDGRFEDLP
ncbi:hypothetical protein ABE438_14510 [Bosea sp. TWI1241]|uniref:hypothetical protein n=1 Tax=Bosea sp. TWI1241 TaxID=3148904 RepID=UPI00320B819C